MLRLLALLTVGATAGVGCGDGPSYARDRDGVLHIILDEYRIRPLHVQASAGPLRLVATNTGRLTHNVAIESVTRAEGEQATQYGRTVTLQPRERGSEREPIVLRPGTYRLTCTIANHDDLGQYGELEVVAE